MPRLPKTPESQKAQMEKRKELRANLIERLDRKEPIPLSEAIILQRKIMGLTQLQLAKRAGVGVQAVKALELETGNPTLKTAEKILAALGGLRLYVGR